MLHCLPYQPLELPIRIQRTLLRGGVLPYTELYRTRAITPFTAISRFALKPLFNVYIMLCKVFKNTDNRVIQQLLHLFKLSFPIITEARPSLLSPIPAANAPACKPD